MLHWIDNKPFSNQSKLTYKPHHSLEFNAQEFFKIYPQTPYSSDWKGHVAWIYWSSGGKDDSKKSAMQLYTFN